MGITLLSGLMYAASVRSKSKRERAAAQAQSMAENREIHYGIQTDPKTKSKSFKSYDLGDLNYPPDNFKVLQVKVGSAAPFSVDYPDENKPQYESLFHDPHMNDFVTRPEIDTRLKNNVYVNDGFVSEEDVVDPESFLRIGQRSLTGQNYLPSDKIIDSMIPGFFKQEVEPSETTNQIFINPKFPNKKYDAMTYFQESENMDVIPHIFNETKKTDKNNKTTTSMTLTNYDEVVAATKANKLAKKDKKKVYQYKGAFVDYNALAEKIKNNEITETVHMYDAETIEGNIVYEDESNTIPRIVAGTKDTFYEPPVADSITTQQFTVQGKVFDDLYKAIVHAKRIKGKLVAAGASNTDVEIYSKNITKKGDVITGSASETSTFLSAYEAKEEDVTTTLFRGFNNEGDSKLASSQKELKDLGFNEEVQKLEDVKVDITGEPISIGNITMMEQKQTLSKNSRIDVQEIVDGKPNGKTEFILVSDYMNEPDKYMPVSGNIFTLKSDSDDGSGNVNTVEVANIGDLDSLAKQADNVKEQSEFGSPIVFQTLDSQTQKPKEFPIQTKDSGSGSAVNRSRYVDLLTDESVVKEINADTEIGKGIRERLLAQMVLEATTFAFKTDNPPGSEGINFNKQLLGSQWLRNQLPTFYRVKGFENAYDLAMMAAIEKHKDNLITYTNKNINIPGIGAADAGNVLDGDGEVLAPILLPEKYHSVFNKFANDTSGIWGAGNEFVDKQRRVSIVANHVVMKKDKRTGLIEKHIGENGEEYTVPADDQPFLDMYEKLSNTRNPVGNESQLTVFAKFLAKPMTNVLDDYDINPQIKEELATTLALASNGNPAQAISFVKTFIPRDLKGDYTYLRMLGTLDGNRLKGMGIATNELEKIKTNHGQRADAAATAIQTLQDMIQTYFNEDGSFINMNSWQAQLYLNAKGAVTIASQLVPIPENAMQELFLGNNKEMVDSFKASTEQFTSILDTDMSLTDSQRTKLEQARDSNLKVKNNIIAKIQSATTEKTKRLAQREYFKYMLAYQMAAAIQGGTGGRTISDQDVQNILKAFNFGIFKSAETEVYSLQAALKMMTTIEAFAKAKGEGGLTGAAAYRAEELLKNYGFGLRKPLTSEMIAHAIKEEGSSLYSGQTDIEFKTLDSVLPENKSGIRKIIKENLSIDQIYDPRDDNMSDDDFFKKHKQQFDSLINSMATATS